VAAIVRRRSGWRRDRSVVSRIIGEVVELELLDGRMPPTDGKRIPLPQGHSRNSRSTISNTAKPIAAPRPPLLSACQSRFCANRQPEGRRFDRINYTSTPCCVKANPTPGPAVPRPTTPNVDGHVGLLVNAGKKPSRHLQP
jgi:hypothetical protein